LGSLAQYWHKTTASINKVFRQQTPNQPSLNDVEREILDLKIEHQTLAGKLDRIHTDCERSSTNELRRIAVIEQTYQETEAARIAGTKKLVELQNHLGEVQALRKLDHDQIKVIKASLTETTSRFEARANQLKFIQDSANEQLRAFKTSLAEASSRLETRDNDLRQQQDSAQEQIVALEAAVDEISGRFKTKGDEIREIRVTIAQQIERLEAFYSSLSAMLENTHDQTKVLENKLDTALQLQENRFQDTQSRLYNQDKRLDRTLVMTLSTLAIVVITGAILFWGIY
jgi:chromosome segregation ATPase